MSCFLAHFVVPPQPTIDRQNSELYRQGVRAQGPGAMGEVSSEGVVASVARMLAAEALSEDHEVGLERHLAHERQLKLHIIIVILTGLIATSLLFEAGKEHLMEKTSENMAPIMDSLFGELTL